MCGPAASPESLLRWTRVVEALGYHFVMISDHVAPTPDVMARYAVRMQELGVDVIGACCGSTPAHIAAMRDALGVGAFAER